MAKQISLYDRLPNWTKKPNAYKMALDSETLNRIMNDAVRHNRAWFIRDSQLIPNLEDAIYEACLDYVDEYELCMACSTPMYISSTLGIPMYEYHGTHTLEQVATQVANHLYSAINKGFIELRVVSTRVMNIHINTELTFDTTKYPMISMFDNNAAAFARVCTTTRDSGVRNRLIRELAAQNPYHIANMQTPIRKRIEGGRVKVGSVW